jgi:hypothetical protein
MRFSFITIYCSRNSERTSARAHNSLLVSHKQQKITGTSRRRARVHYYLRFAHLPASLTVAINNSRWELRQSKVACSPVFNISTISAGVSALRK